MHLDAQWEHMLGAVRRAHFARRLNQKILIHAPKDQRHCTVNKDKMCSEMHISGKTIFLRFFFVFQHQESHFVCSRRVDQDVMLFFKCTGLS